MSEKITVVHGPNEDFVLAAGCSVGRIKKSLRDLFNIPSDAVGFVDGVPVSDTYTLAGGERLEFVREWGEKGLGELLTKEQLMDRWSIGEDDYRKLVGMGLPALELPVGVRHPEFAVDTWFAAMGNGDRGVARTLEDINEKLDRPHVGDSSFTVAEVANLLKVSVSKVYHLTESGELENYKVGNQTRVTQSQLEKYQTRNLRTELPKTARKRRSHNQSEADRLFGEGWQC